MGNSEENQNNNESEIIVNKNRELENNNDINNELSPFHSVLLGLRINYKVTEEIKFYVQTRNKNGKTVYSTQTKVQLNISTKFFGAIISSFTLKDLENGNYEFILSPQSEGVFLFETLIIFANQQHKIENFVHIYRDTLFRSLNKNNINHNNENLAEIGIINLHEQNEKFDFPTCIKVDIHNRFIITDQNNHRILLLNSSSKILKIITEVDQQKLNTPWGIAIHPLNADVYISDHNNHQIIVFDCKLNFKFKFGLNKKFKSDFQPTGIDFDTKFQQLLVADYANHCLQIFDSDGNFIRRIGKKGSSDGDFRYPVDVCFSPMTNQIIVSDQGNHRVQIFNPNGQFIQTLGQKSDKITKFLYPVGVFADKFDGKIFVVDRNNHRIHFFDKDGEPINQLSNFDFFDEFEKVKFDPHSWLENENDLSTNQLILYRPAGITFHYNGSLLICNGAFHNILFLSAR